MRPYAVTDLPHLRRALAGWIAQAGPCGYDHVGGLDQRINADLRHHPVPGELVQVWDSGGVVVGLAVTLRFGVAFDVFTTPALRGTPAERRMLHVAAVTTARRMTAGRHVLTDVYECDDTRMRLLRGLGFDRFRTWDEVRERDLAGPVAAPQPPAGFRVRPARLADADQLAAARNDCFGQDWTGASYRSAVMTGPGYDPAREIVVEAPDGRIVSFAVYWVDELNRTGHFEPVGTRRGFHRRGLARAAMLEAMTRMRAAGLTSVTVNHDATNAPARRLYASLGFTRRCRTYGFRRSRPAVLAG